MDADVLGPSIPGLLRLPVGQPPTTTPDGKIVPADRPNLKVMSMGMVTRDDNPAILRGPMVGKYLKMFIGTVQWGRLELLETFRSLERAGCAIGCGAQDVRGSRQERFHGGCAVIAWQEDRDHRAPRSVPFRRPSSSASTWAVPAAPSRQLPRKAVGERLVDLVRKRSASV
jgi:hypothetical protein